MGLRLVSKAVRHRGTAGESVLACKGGQSILLGGTWRGSGEHKVIQVEVVSAFTGRILRILSISYRVSGYPAAGFTLV